ncbi:hypothetical protein ASE52_14390 [Acidovorax sp. Root275]|uniref:hypothetical protein n=1 Tax=Acidovorax sp. Root275 TaxID=1736508 RepID=UPI00070B8989|nr:hypothetical protein [Acidovorax sp. Root275]KRD48525.1 hypothetical protein ASE52_14390 [Acidovorax sp. Root275]
MPSSPTIVLLGAPGTGAQALSDALHMQLAAGSAHILCNPALCGLPPEEVIEASLILLMGLDLPCPAGERAAQEAVDARLRVDLAQAGMGYRVVYGHGEQRIANAMIAIKNIAKNTHQSSTRGIFDPKSDASTRTPARLRAWNCEKCSDPECEYRLFTALTGRDTRTT